MFTCFETFINLRYNIGSANINDRSLLGDRDSEIAIVMEDSELFHERWNGKQVTVGRFGHSLRTRLWAEHLGIDSNNEEEMACIIDPITCHVWVDLLQARARKNTEILEDVFHCLPSDLVVDLSGPEDDLPTSKDVVATEVVATSSTIDLNAAATMNVQSATTYSLEIAADFIYENERYVWGKGWSATHLTKSDPTSWTQGSGTPISDTSNPSEGWTIHSDGHCDSDGWHYKTSFNDLTLGRNTAGVFRMVRTRCWKKEEKEELKTLRGLLTKNASQSHDDFYISERDLRDVHGHLVLFPLQFLKNVPLRPKILPKSIFI